jgi:sugar/nucleoside kinase (ribokinase family)
MDFGIEIPGEKQYDAVALGLNAVDHLIVVPRYPEFNSKVEFLSHTQSAGGQSATAMVALARLGLRTRYIGKVGSDVTGRFQINSIASEGVQPTIDIVEGAESQIAFIVVDKPSGERTILWHRDRRLIIEPSEVDRAEVASGRILHLDGHDVDASIQAATYARQAGVPTVLDIDNVYPGADRLLPLIDFIIGSSDFPKRVTGAADLRESLRELSEKTGSLFIAATTGNDGVLAYFAGQYFHSAAFEVECRDTTGAGDAFHGGFIYGLLEGMSVEDTLTFANAVAALNCRGIGARTSLPRLDEVHELIATGRRRPSRR